MHLDLAAEIAALPRLRVSELRAKFVTVFGEPTPSHNKVWLVKRIAWRLQAQAEGDLSERARQRAAELAADADLRLSAPTAQEMPDQPPTLRVPADERMPRPGTERYVLDQVAPHAPNVDWPTLAPGERAARLRQLVAGIDYDGTHQRVAITLRSNPPSTAEVS